MRKRIVIYGAVALALLAGYCIGGTPFARWWTGTDRPLKRLDDGDPLPTDECAEITLEIIPGDPIRMTLNPDDTVITPAMRSNRNWEPKETCWFLQILGEGDTVVDIGANVGYYTLLAAKRVGETGRVYAFEPDPVSFSILERNVRINGLSNVVLEQKAVSDEKGTLTLHIAPKNKGDHRIYKTEGSRESVQVEAVSLDEYFKDYDRRIDFVKIDTQGAEVLILRGMKDIIGRNPRMALMVEFWPHGLKGLGSTGEDLLGIFRDNDLRLFHMNIHPQLIPARDDELLSTNTVQNGAFSNLLAVKGLSERNRLTKALQEKTKAFEADTDKLDEARRQWEADLRGQIEEPPQGAANPPPDLQSALRTDPALRTPGQHALLKNRFRSTTPLLEKERAERDHARQELESFERAFLHGK